MNITMGDTTRETRNGWDHYATPVTITADGGNTVSITWRAGLALAPEPTVDQLWADLYRGWLDATDQGSSHVGTMGQLMAELVDDYGMTGAEAFDAAQELRDIALFVERLGDYSLADMREAYESEND